jgi:hypothetical protein
MLSPDDPRTRLEDLEYATLNTITMVKILEELKK